MIENDRTTQGDVMAETFNSTETNSFTKNKFQLNISNFPNLSNIPDIEVNLNVFNTNVKNLEVPNKNIPMLKSNWQHEEQKHPNPVGARDKNTLTVEWILDENFLNFFLFDSWANGTLYGIPARQREPGRPGLLRDNCIDRLDVYALDNTGKMPTAVLSFYRCFLTGLGSLHLEFGVADVVTFSTTFEYEQFGISIQRKRHDGSYVLEPLRQAVSTAGRRV